MSAILAKLIDLIPGLKLRASEDAELFGMDDDQHGEFSYDYVEVRRDFLAWTPYRGDPAHEGSDVIEPQHGIRAHASLARPAGSFASASEGPKGEKTTATSLTASAAVSLKSAKVGENGEKKE